MARMRRACLASAVRAASARNCEILKSWCVISIADMLPAPRINDMLHRVTVAVVWETPQESGSQAAGITPVPPPARRGKTDCKGRSIAMAKLDTLVTTHVADRLLGPNRLAGLLTLLAEKRASSDAEVRGRGRALQAEIAQADGKLRRLYKMVEDDVTALDNVLGDRLAALKCERERAKAALERIKVQSAPQIALEPDQIERFGAFMRERITEGESTFRKAYLRSIIDAIEAGDKVIRIHGSKASLEQAVIAGEQIGKGSQFCTQMARPERFELTTPGFVVQNVKTTAGPPKRGG